MLETSSSFLSPRVSYTFAGGGEREVPERGGTRCVLAGREGRSGGKGDAVRLGARLKARAGRQVRWKHPRMVSKHHEQQRIVNWMKVSAVDDEQERVMYEAGGQIIGTMQGMVR